MATDDVQHYAVLTMGKCKNEINHTSQPIGYMSWHIWATQKNKTHRQIKCDRCRLFVIWIKR